MEFEILPFTLLCRTVLGPGSVPLKKQVQLLSYPLSVTFVTFKYNS